MCFWTARWRVCWPLAAALQSGLFLQCCALILLAFRIDAQELSGVFPEGSLARLVAACGSTEALCAVLGIAASLHFLPAAGAVRTQ